jgi:putative oxidoreductase
VYRNCPSETIFVPTAAAKFVSGSADAVQRAFAALDRIPYWIIALAARSFPAAVFWQSGQTKVEGFHLKPCTIALFANEYQLPIIDPTAAAYLWHSANTFFPSCSCSGFQRDSRLSGCCS